MYSKKRTVPRNRRLAAQSSVDIQAEKQNPVTHEYTAELELIFSLLKLHTSHDFSSYKLSTIYRRIEKQMHALKIDSIYDYAQFLGSNPSEIKKLFKDLLIGVTSFFRDETAFKVLKNEINYRLKNKTSNGTFRVWVPGCSTGEEAYSIAMLVHEILAETNQHHNIQIFATDIDLTALEIARAAIYSKNKIDNISSTRLQRFFTLENNYYRIKPEIRKMVTFGSQNIIHDPPFTRLDMLSCRNLLIYLNADLQEKLIPVFHFSLKPEGILFLGPSESISDHPDLFQLINKRWQLYVRKETIGGTYLFNPSFDKQPFQTKNNLLSFYQQINHKQKIKSSTTDIIQPTAQHVKNIRKQYPTIKKMSTKIMELEHSLQHSEEIFLATIANLQSDIEDLQITNEELQSINEEIETSKEELYSLNEELTVANTELQTQIDRLVTLNDNINNLFDSTEIAAIFIDNNICVKRFTPKALEIISLRLMDIGRALDHFATNIKYDRLIDDVKEVLKTSHHQSLIAESKLGKWFLIKILPYRTANIIAGAVITFTDITEYKIAEMKLMQNNLELNQSALTTKHIFESVKQPMLILNAKFIITLANSAFYRLYNLRPDQTIGKTLAQTLTNLPLNDLQDILEKKSNTIEVPIKLQVQSSDSKSKDVLINVKKIQISDNKTIIWLTFDEV